MERGFFGFGGFSQINLDFLRENPSNQRHPCSIALNAHIPMGVFFNPAMHDIVKELA
jgi:hypothetical protein